ncbi:MAG: LLM class flavin-dependent oxidoreductase, partial [Rhodospirillaceae bacterium]|nr:LLM class flavin-dependent oxidoreductase [Rhodospirillaceae bacterium]
MKFGLLFAYQNPPDSGIPWQEPYADMLNCLPRAEALGYSSALQASHHIQKDGFCPSPMVAMAGAAAVTERSLNCRCWMDAIDGRAAADGRPQLPG